MLTPKQITVLRDLVQSVSITSYREGVKAMSDSTEDYTHAVREAKKSAVDLRAYIDSLAKKEA